MYVIHHIGVVRLHRFILRLDVVLVVLFGLFPAVASAQGSAGLASARSRLRHEPSATETIDHALRYFRVSSDAIGALRAAARSRGLLPLVAGGYRYDDFLEGKHTIQGPTDLRSIAEGVDERIHSFTIGAIWDLRELLFNPAEVQSYGLIGLQRDLMLEVTRTYFLRRQLMLRLLLRPPEDPLARAALELRVDEFTAVLDALTGGWYTEESRQRYRSRRGTELVQ